MNTQIPISSKNSSQCLSKDHCPYLNFASTTHVINAESLVEERNYLRERVNKLENFLNLATEEINKLKEQNKKLEEENKFLKEEKLSLIKEKFKPNLKKEERKPKKKGAPIGHIGVTRKKPTKIDKYVDVECSSCPDCSGDNLKELKDKITGEPVTEDHTVEDIEIIIKAICYRHHVYYCYDCKKVVTGRSAEELKKSYIGPAAVSLSHALRYEINISYGKIIKILRILGLEVTKGTLIKMENRLVKLLEGFYERLLEIIKKQEQIHGDETGWRVDGMNYWLWVFTNALIALYHIDPTRGSCVVEKILGKEYAGILISDCYSAYNILEKAIKQKCASHFLKDNHELSKIESEEVQKFYTELKSILQSAIQIHKDYKEEKATKEDLQTTKTQLSKELKELLSNHMENLEAEKLRKRLDKHFNEIFTFLEHPEIDATNNRAERQLRQNVIMRKITFGNRSPQGAKNHSVIMSVSETAKLHGYAPYEIFYEVVTGKKEKLEKLLEDTKPRPP